MGRVLGNYFVYFSALWVLHGRGVGSASSRNGSRSSGEVKSLKAQSELPIYSKARRREVSWLIRHLADR